MQKHLPGNGENKVLHFNEAIEHSIDSYFIRWLSAPRNLKSVTLISSTAKLQLPTRSLVEEWKAAETQLYMMLRDSGDPLMCVQPEVQIGKECSVRYAVEEAEI